MRPVCVPCQKEMKCSKNGRIVHESAHDAFGYRHGDEYTCPSCGHKIISGFGLKPIHRDQVTDEEIKTVVVV